MNRLFTIFIVCISLANTVTAQYLSNKGFFSVDEKRGCVPLTINYTNLKAGACNAGAPCDVKFEVVSTVADCMNAYSGSPVPFIQNPSTPFTFTQAGTYRLITLYQGDCDEITITVTESIQPEFNIFTCANNGVQVVVTDTNYDSYFINYNDGTEVQVPQGALAKSQHTYLSSGNKTISVRGKDVNADDNCAVNAKSVTAVTTLTAPTINTLTVNNNGTDIDLDFTGLPNTQYRLEVAVNSTSTFQIIKTLNDVSSVTVNNLRTDDNYYCFRLGAYDPCNGTSTYSNTVCSINFDVTAENNQNALTWQTGIPGGTQYNIFRDNLSVGGTANKSYDDTPITCNQTYSYYLSATYGGATSISSTKSVTSFSSDIPTAITDVTATVSSNGVELTWQPDAVFVATQYKVFKQSGTGSYTFNGSTSITTYTDPGYSTEAQSCYQVNYSDECGNTSANTIDVCPIRLEGVQQGTNDVSLTWSDYLGWANGVASYTVEKYDEQGALIATFAAGTATTYLDTSTDPNTQIYLYVVKANAVDAGLGQAVSNQIRIVKKPILRFPSAFTPDGVGEPENELFRMACCNLYIAEYDLKVFNRWGELIYATNDVNEGWNGQYNSKDQPEGTYAYIAVIRDLIGKEYTRSGSLVLLRKQ